MPILFNYIICHYGEIGIKGKNRNFFEQALLNNIRRKLSEEIPGSFERAQKISGRIIIQLSTKGMRNKKSVQKILENIFGIVYFAFSAESVQDLETLKKDCLNLIQTGRHKTFRITAQRSKKDFPLTSQEINQEIGAYVVDKTKKKVNLKKPGINCFIEIVDQYAFLYSKKIKGAGGMPVGTGGKALVLLSGGIDSPVAAYYGLKRGIKTFFLHFHSIPYTSPASIEKVKKLASSLKKFQAPQEIFLIPFAEIQKEIMMKTPPKLRVVLYRRMMLKIAEKIAEKNNFLAIITGDSAGQVASQTLENIKAIEEAVVIPVLRPLIGFDKEEIIEKAKIIGTFEISILPHEDCCTRFIPKHPETKADIGEVKKAEKNLDTVKMVQEAIRNIKLVKL